MRPVGGVRRATVTLALVLLGSPSGVSLLSAMDAPIAANATVLTTNCPTLDRNTTASHISPCENPTCVWFPNGSVATCGRCSTPPARRHSSITHYVVGGYMDPVTHTPAVPISKIDYIEYLPAATETIKIRNMQVARLNTNLTTSHNGQPVIATILDLGNNSIADISNVFFPRKVLQLNLSFNLLTSVRDVGFPDKLSILDLSFNPIQTLVGVALPNDLRMLSLRNTSQDILRDAIFPPNMEHLILESSTFQDVYSNFPASLKCLCLGASSLGAIYANETQFQLLANLTNGNKTAWAVRCNTTCSTRLPNATVLAHCKHQMKSRLLWSQLIVCILDGDESAPSIGVATAILLGVLCTLALVAAGYLGHRCFKRRREWYKQSGVGDVAPWAQIDALTQDIRTDEDMLSYFIPPDQVRRMDELKTCSNGIIFAATMTSTEDGVHRVSMKQMLPARATEIRAVEDFMDEIRLCISLSHPNIAQCIGFSWTTLANIAMIMEPMGYGDVSTILKADSKEQTLGWNVKYHFELEFDDIPRLSSLFKRESIGGLVDPGRAYSKFGILSDIVNALLYLHTFDPPVLHLDVKASNVWLSDECRAKLVNFGERSGRVVTLDSIGWVAPEVLVGGPASTTSDVFALGVFISELDTGSPPYLSLRGRKADNHVDMQAQILNSVISGQLRPALSRVCPESVLEITRRCVAFEPTDRPTIVEIRSWLDQYL
ncbi:Aste57867_24803 [Aphanomyces stellatus]|uniref:Aste57867_24803 protein n=1 Tax=Aphanomyces stellatus TaxID=120398 RepID=A0A485LTH0_9STRA|nr:hypothetical protein As57867_024725 [Aphanomyces stellatus]VFU01438.1 Aste57867_24803 [Aphanomyces stellatus]